MFARSEISSNLFTNESYDNKILSDITHGQIYRRFLTTIEGESIKNKHGCTFILNTDGVQISLKSTLSIWPVYLVINELPKHMRFQFPNIIIAGKLKFLKKVFLLLCICLYYRFLGLSISHGKPNLNSLFEPIIQELKSLQYGIMLNYNNQNRLFKFVTLFGLFDKPARTDILNTNATTGYYGCIKCYIQGESFVTNKSKYLFYLKKNRALVLSWI